MRKTIANLTRGVYDHDAHADLADRGFRRYHPFSFDFDSTFVSLTETEDHWEEQGKRHHRENRARAVKQLLISLGVPSARLTTIAINSNIVKLKIGNLVTDLKLRK